MNLVSLTYYKLKLWVITLATAAIVGASFYQIYSMRFEIL